MNNTVSDKLKNKFIDFLSNEGLSSQTQKLYKSDLSHFLSWLIFKVRTYGSYAETLAEITPFLNSKIALDYKTFLTENNTPPATTNRRLSTVRRLSEFLVATQILDFDFAKGLENISTTKTTSVVDLFKKYLMEEEKASKNTVKNYLSDVNQFLSWVKESQLR